MNVFLRLFGFLSAIILVISSASVPLACADDLADGWKNESQAGIVTTSGNSDTSTVSAAQTTSYRVGLNFWQFSARHMYQKNSDVVSAKSWSIGLRYERELSELFSLFAAETVEGDRFKDLKQSYSTDIGAKYRIAKTETLDWSTEAGYRFTRENISQLSRTLHYARLFTSLEKKWNASFSTRYYIEVFPNFTNSKDWKANTELSLSAVLSSIFSVKSAYLIRYDNEPNAPGLRSADKSFTTALVAKF
ncbi:MAG: DUF481 domain-containing protein [Cryobacterium sp.]|nr:DUF481 domain-containing protein [Oligoflexia bacterium]